ncbi:MAG: Monosaccharide-transporting ATPase [Frankiales bacterium]|nr:Monosaccharide-transporting ATPase [Frankiales bacterium]
MVAASSPVLATNGLTKHFRSVRALEDVSMRADDREIVGIIGPNGAGKTTLFNLIAGAFRPTSGTVTFGGKDIGRMPAYQRCRHGIGRTFQLIQPFGSMTVVENIAVAISATGVGLGAARERAAELAHRTGLGPIAEKVAGEVNAVEGKRLELARALGSSPTLILLDEIFSGLNAEEVTDLIAIVRKLPDDGLTVLLIEHNVGAIRRVTDRVLAIDAGRLVSEGTPEQVLSDPIVMESYLGQRASA